MPELANETEGRLVKIQYPIKDILISIADKRRISLVRFVGEYFLPKEQKEKFPHLADLARHSGCMGRGIEIRKEGITAFEGSVDGLALAYFGHEFEEHSGITKEDALVKFGGRRIHLTLNENGLGHIDITDPKVEKARWELSQDSFGGMYDKHPKAEYGFHQEYGSKLDGVRKFLEEMIR